MSDPIKPVYVPVSKLRVDPRGEGHGRGQDQQEHNQEHAPKDHKKMAPKNGSFFVPAHGAPPPLKEEEPPQESLAHRFLEKIIKSVSR